MPRNDSQMIPFRVHFNVYVQFSFEMCVWCGPFSVNNIVKLALFVIISMSSAGWTEHFQNADASTLFDCIYLNRTKIQFNAIPEIMKLLYNRNVKLIAIMVSDFVRPVERKNKNTPWAHAQHKF